MVKGRIVSDSKSHKDHTATSAVRKGDFEGGDLRDELRQALNNFDFEGRFAAQKKLPQAPGPRLVIEGVGSVSLPLSEVDAKNIIALTEPPASRGKKKGKKQTRSEWEVDGSKISFQGSSWKSYLNETVLKFVRENLGLEEIPQFQLSKLLLHGSGSEDLSFENSDDQAKGTIASLVIILPSAYTGGEVIFSHSAWGEAKFDLSRWSTSTNAFVWYSEVGQALDPITSGYRLALVYSLVHTVRNVPKPTLPSIEDDTQNLKRVLQKWSHNKYPRQTDEDDDMFIYLLDDYRLDHKLTRGIACLANKDQYKVMCAQSTAEENGFRTLLGNVELVITGSPEDTHYRDYYRSRKRNRHRYDYYDSLCCGGRDENDSDECGLGHDADDMEMEEEFERTLQVKVMAETGGGSLGPAELEIEEDRIVQPSPFDNVPPDERKFDGDRSVRCAGNQLEFRYYRTALIFLKEEKADELLFSIYGLSYVIRELQNIHSDEIPPDLLKLTNLAVEKLDPDSESEENVRSLAKIALGWEDLVMFGDICKNIGYDIDFVGAENYVEAVNIFSFGALHPLLAECLAGTSSTVSEQVELLRSISALALPTKGGGRKWCQDQLKALERAK